MSVDASGMVAVIGAGPAGLLAAQAVADLDLQPIIFTAGDGPSQIGGATYLHEPIASLMQPGAPTGLIRFRKVGTPEGYAEKLYGDARAPSSWSKFGDGEVRPAWSVQDMYAKLWARWEDSILPGMQLRPIDLDAMSETYSLVINSAPAQAFCELTPSCSFQATQVYVSQNLDGRASTLDGLAPTLAREVGENEIIYDGRPGEQFYRYSRIFGRESVESVKPFNGQTGYGIKPTTTTCKCQRGVTVQVGRFGKWDKNVLMHEAYKDAMNAVLNIEGGV